MGSEPRATLRTMVRWLLISGIFLLTAAVVFWQALVHTLHLGTVSVPDLATLTAEEAERAVHDVGLALLLDPAGAFSVAVEAGQVAEQDPLPGYHVKTGSTVIARLSLGSRRVTVPDLSGQSLQAAQRELERLGLVAGPEVKLVAHANGDFVVASQPSAGSEVAPGARVDLLVNVTPRRELWVMPPLLSRSVAAVQAFCRDNHLRLGHVHEVPYPGVASGTVLRQYPPSGSPLSRSDIITVWVSR